MANDKPTNLVQQPMGDVFKGSRFRTPLAIAPSTPSDTAPKPAQQPRAQVEPTPAPEAPTPSAEPGQSE